MDSAARIKELRMKLGISQAKLARMVGVTPAAVGNYEQGISFPKSEVLKKLFGALHCTPNEFFEVAELYTEKDYEHFKVYAKLSEDEKALVEECTKKDFKHLKMYRQLNSDSRQIVDECTEFELSKVNNDTVKVAARGGSAEIGLKKRSGKNILDADSYNSKRKK